VILGYLDDPFARHFVRRSSRRPPLINVGTFVRTWSVDTLVWAFLDSGGDTKKQIVSLGAGTDTRFFRIVRDGQAHRLHRYVEVDFPESTAKKARTIRTHDDLSACLGDDIKLGPFSQEANLCSGRS
jgi:O-methyltransferase involved in polyketide biosynthesis